MKAVTCWKDGEQWYMLRDDDGTFSHVVATKAEAVADGATVFIEVEEPRFLIRNESGRGFANEVAYSEFTETDRDHVEDDEDPDSSFGEWLDNSTAGDEYRNTDDNFVAIRIN